MQLSAATHIQLYGLITELILPGTTAAEAFRGASEALKSASPVGAVLAGLTRLDLSRGIATMAAADAVALLCACPALRHFSAPDVKVIGAHSEGFCPWRMSIILLLIPTFLHFYILRI